MKLIASNPTRQSAPSQTPLYVMYGGMLHVFRTEDQIRRFCLWEGLYSRPETPAA